MALNMLSGTKDIFNTCGGDDDDYYDNDDYDGVSCRGERSKVPFCLIS